MKMNVAKNGSKATIVTELYFRSKVVVKVVFFMIFSLLF